MLLNRLGDGYVDALDAQRRILRDVWAECDGIELGTEGDSFYVVFAAAEQAARAVALGQRALAAHAVAGWRSGPRPDGPAHAARRCRTPAPMSASMCTAPPGSPPQRTADRSSAPLRRPTWSRTGCPTVLALRDLGEHRFKDLEHPEHVFQLEVAGLDQTFPPLRSLGTVDEPPACGRRVARPRRRARRAGRMGSRRPRPPAHPDRAWRHGQDHARHRVGAVTRRRLPGGRLLRGARVGGRRERCLGRDRRGSRTGGRARAGGRRRAPLQPSHAASCSTTWSRSPRRRRSCTG